MPGIITTELGKISISEDIIAMIAGYAASENYGIVGMSAKTTGDQLAARWRRQPKTRRKGDGA